MFFSAQNYVYSVRKYVYSVRKYVYSVQNNFFFCQKICSFCPKNRWNPLLGRYRFALARVKPWSHPLEDLNQRPTENSNNTYSTSKRSVLHQQFTNCSNLAKNTCCSTYSLIAQWQYWYISTVGDMVPICSGVWSSYLFFKSEGCWFNSRNLGSIKVSFYQWLGFWCVSFLIQLL